MQFRITVLTWCLRSSPFVGGECVPAYGLGMTFTSILLIVKIKNNLLIKDGSGAECMSFVYLHITRTYSVQQVVSMSSELSCFENMNVEDCC